MSENSNLRHRRRLLQLLLEFTLFRNVPRFTYEDRLESVRIGSEIYSGRLWLVAVTCRQVIFGYPGLRSTMVDGRIVHDSGLWPPLL